MTTHTTRPSQVQSCSAAHLCVLWCVCCALQLAPTLAVCCSLSLPVLLVSPIFTFPCTRLAPRFGLSFTCTHHHSDAIACLSHPSRRHRPAGNINQLVLKLSTYTAELHRHGGVIAEFVNPKYTDASKTTFKSSTRLECMMQVGAGGGCLVCSCLLLG